MFHYIDGAAEDEVTLRANTGDFDVWRWAPNYLVDVAKVDPSARIMGMESTLPLMLSPTGMSRLFHPDGEIAVSRAAAAQGLPYCLSTMGSTTIEDVAAASEGAHCFQIYGFRDRALTREFIERARAAGYQSLCLTVDVPVAGNRERDLRTGLMVPPRLTIASALAIAARPGWLVRYLKSEPLSLANVSHRVKDTDGALVEYINGQFDPSLTWDDVAWMVEAWGGPFAIKGVLRADDARRAIEVGASAVMVSNHGGRQLDGAVTPIEILPDIVEAVDGRAEVILDGGVRRGSHVLKAIALGATACMIGRPYLYGLGAAGQPGVDRALSILREEIMRAMALLGARSLSEVGPDHLRRFTGSQERPR